MNKQDFIDHFIELWMKFKEDNPNAPPDLVSIEWFVDWLLTEKQP